MGEESKFDLTHNLSIYEAARRVPQEAQRPIQAGRLKGKTDINPMWRIKLLTDLFGPCGFGWYTEEVEHWTERSGDEIAAFVTIRLYVKYNGEWSKPILGSGGSSLVAKERNGLYLSDEAYKMAETDAISVCCKKLGFGADIYWNADHDKYTQQPPQAPAPIPPQGQPVPQPQGFDPQGRLPQEPSTADQLIRIKNEMARTGVDEKQICERYRVNRLQDLNYLNAEKALSVLAQVSARA